MVKMHISSIERECLRELTEAREERDNLRQALEAIKEAYEMDIDAFYDKYGFMDLEEAMMTHVYAVIGGE